MKNIVYLVSTLKRTGPTNQLFNIVSNLDRNMYNFKVITLSPEPEDSLIEKFLGNNIEVKSLQLSRAEGILTGPKKLKKILNEFKPDIIHTQGIRSDFMSASFLKEYKRVATLRNYPLLDYVMTYGKIVGKFMAYVHLNVLRKIEAPVACSYSISKMVDKHNVKTSVVQNGVDTNNFFPISDIQKKKLREELNLPHDKKIIISVGHLSSRKDPEKVIRGFVNSNASENGELILIGDGHLRNECNHFAQKYDNVKILGRTDKVSDYLRASDYFISASKAEGFPNSVLEALASGLPICLSDIEPHKEFFKFDDQIGVLFKTENENSLIIKLNDLIANDNYEEIKNSTISVIEKHLSAKKMSENYMAIYEKISH
ncbi:glycosyltransferase family 4 protein [Bacillus sp. JJ1562]|uniref:glycosyltransferase family 4 protein n=1 Tax=Bacillus sp. JJ1562 TaxID=3122960 RepID=UPI0030022E9C